MPKFITRTENLMSTSVWKFLYIYHKQQQMVSGQTSRQLVQ